MLDNSALKWLVGYAQIYMSKAAHKLVYRQDFPQVGTVAPMQPSTLLRPINHLFTFSRVRDGATITRFADMATPGRTSPARAGSTGRRRRGAPPGWASH